ncbi:MAG: glycerophosphodiester phosphodiesterase family protein [Lachnospira sp.]
MFDNYKNRFKLLHDSKRNAVLFEITYKLAATAIVYPLVILVINLCMKAAGVRYLTNEYIYRAVMNPFVIIGLIAAVLLFVAYCTYEMSYLAVCFETKRKGYNASIIDNMYNALLRMKKLAGVKIIPLFLFYFISIIFVNVTTVCNIVFSQTTFNLFKLYVWRRGILVKVSIIIAIAIIYAVVILGIYSFNIYVLEGRNFRDSYKKSISLVRKHPVGTIGTIVIYNLRVFIAIMAIYAVISVVLVAGVKILNMAYMGSAVYLSVLKGVKLCVKLILVYVAIPMTFSAISAMYYKYSDEKDINFQFVDIEEGSARRNSIIYKGILIISTILVISYIAISVNKNPFENVAIFHETKISAHRGYSVAAPENTLAAFREAIDSMADEIELDVQMTKDGILVVMHDSSAYRTCGVDRNISDMTYKEVRQLDAGFWYGEEFVGERVPSLAEVLELAKGKIDLNIEIKADNNKQTIAKKVVKLIKRYGMEESCVITSFDYDILKEVKAVDKDIQVGYILSVAYGNFYEMDDVDFFSVSASFLTKNVVDAIHNSGKQVYVWTVNNESSIKNLTNKGVDNIITDEPVLARETIYARDTSETMINMIKYVFNR